MAEILNDIKEKIEKINQDLEKFIGKLYLSNRFFNSERIDEDILSEDVELLEIVLKKIKRQFNIGKKISNVSVVLFILFTAFILLNDLFFDLKIGHGININFMSFILMVFVFFKSTNNYYKVKVNLEYKIYLLRLLDKFQKVKIKV